MRKSFLSTTAVVIVSVISFTSTIRAQNLTSTNYEIKDATIDAGGGISQSTNYGLESAIEPTFDRRLSSGSYALGSGFPNGILANVPKILCLESNTTSGNTNCLNFPNANGAQGECGNPGCYDRVKLEVDVQNNPIDTLYLVSVYDNGTGIQYYLQSTHTLSTTYDINDYMTICELEGKDIRSGSGCEISSDPLWDEELQRYNVLNLRPGATYTVRIRALHGDFTESDFGPSGNVTLEYPQMSMDIDIGTNSSANTVAPHTINLGILTPGAPVTASEKIWLDLNTNVFPGFTTYVKDINTGLQSGSNNIPSTSEDLAVDSGGDGGFGLQIDSVTQTSLGPLLEGATYDLSGQNVGGLSPSNVTIFNTNTSGNNKGQITGGRAGILVKALSKLTTPSGNYADTITFTMITNF